VILNEKSICDDAELRHLVVRVVYAAEALLGDASSGVMRQIRTYGQLERLIDELRVKTEEGQLP